MSLEDCIDRLTELASALLEAAVCLKDVVNQRQHLYNLRSVPRYVQPSLEKINEQCRIALERYQKQTFCKDELVCDSEEESEKDAVEKYCAVCRNDDDDDDQLQL